MQIEIRNGRSKIYKHRHDLLSKGMKFNKRSYGRSFYSKKVTEAEKEELILYCKKHRLKYAVIDDVYMRDSHYRKEFLQGYDHKWILCAYCGFPKRTKNITVDHIIPIDKAKKSKRTKKLLQWLHIENVNDKRNLAAACRKCNRRKSTQMGIWILRGFIGKSNIIWVLRWIVRCILIVVIIVQLYNIINL